MNYACGIEDFDLSTMERHAFISGNTELASLIAAFDDETERMREDLTATEADRDDEKNLREEAEERVRELEQRLDRVYTMVEQAQRVSNRAEILKALLP